MMTIVQSAESLAIKVQIIACHSEVTNHEGRSGVVLGFFFIFFFLSFSGWGETESTWYVGHCWPIVPAPDDR
jgi:hypothetical protein